MSRRKSIQRRKFSIIGDLDESLNEGIQVVVDYRFCEV